MLLNKAGMPEHKYMLHRSENLFGRRSNHESLKEGLIGNLGNMEKAVKYSQKSDNEWNRDLKFIKKHKKNYLHHG